MRVYGDIPVWGALEDRSSAKKGWFQQLREWWVAHKVARRQAEERSLGAGMEMEEAANLRRVIGDGPVRSAQRTFCGEIHFS